MKLCTVVIWYNPSDSEVKNIFSYIDFVDRVYVVDNSDKSNSSLLNDMEKVIYLPNYENFGIAKALNIGCSRALQDGFDWCMTMDQDSVWESSQFKLFLENIENLRSDLRVSFGPNLRLPDNTLSTLGELKRKILHKKFVPDYSKKESPNKIITSGNVFNLNAWSDVNGFYEPFFIDEVDHEFCFKLKEKGYEITLFTDIFLNQVIGSPKTSLLPKETHSNLRVYYMTRNRLYMMKMYPDICKIEEYKKNFILFLRSILFTFDIKKLKYFIMGYNDYRKGVSGKKIFC